MKILYVSQYFPPEMGAPAARVAELAQHWSDRGHEVTVLTGFPNHPTGVVPREWRKRFWRLLWRERISGVNVVRTWLWPLPNRKAHQRILNYLSFCLSAGLTGLTVERPDVIIATSPQLLVGLAGWWLGAVKRVPFVFEVRDLWPESLAAVGVGDASSFLHRVLSRLTGFLYRHSAHVVVVTPAFRDHLVRHWGVPAEKISVVENGVETELFSPRSRNTDQALRESLGAANRFLICYVGTLGMAHGLETVLESADQLRLTNPEVLFLLVGEGAEKQKIKSQAAARGLANICFVDQQPREKIPAFISASDAGLVLLKKTELFKTVVPTKMLEVMSCARPVVLGVDGQSRKMVEEAGAGIVIEPENAADLTAAIRQLANDRDLASSYGQNGREYIVRNLSRRRTAEVYLDVLAQILKIPREQTSQAAA